ncbi:8-oxo-dGTP diphosphatase [Brevibacillus sp. AG162]|uniref:(deoxy)nucleoside triphosphate pyrophosphohydrolase n=1 Tax=Brevibacillus sp. AG162 TaxID=2572910 RepID=UPI00114FBAB9|nr:(deoxy)nucleoside triphosphate pyrophosphohydrolase [Brevibacillus sp. AG162]TQK75001.1 8-oxo-dGTP diphosphatase [Brevibacillus sp. AG162]
MKQIEVVGAVIVNESKQILCALRSQNMNLAGFWEFPGGKIEQGEDPKKALYREIKEELSCEIKVGEMIEETVFEYDTATVHLRTFLSTVLNGDPKALEHEKIAWVSVLDLDQLTWAPADIPTVDKLKQLLLH